MKKLWICVTELWEKLVEHKKRLKVTTVITLEKYKSREDYDKRIPFQVLVKEGNVMLVTGMAEMWKLITGQSSYHFDGTNSVIGVGDSATAENEEQTDLLGSNKAYKTVDPGTPISAGKLLMASATFYEDEGNFTWNEAVLKNSGSSICLNRSVINFGTKQSGNIWAISIRITLSN